MYDRAVLVKPYLLNVAITVGHAKQSVLLIVEHCIGRTGHFAQAMGRQAHSPSLQPLHFARQGFDKFFGFLGGETNHWAPFIYDGTHVVELPEDPDYHFLTDMTDQTVAWLRYQKALTPEKPFFIYYAPGAVHAPHHLPADWIANWKGKLDGGWDAMREQIPARQIELGVIPQGTKLDPNLLNR